MSKYALITGGTSGIGLELARLFAQDHYNLVIVARSQAELQQVSNELKPSGIEVIIIAKDLFIPGSAEELYQEVKSKGIEIDVLVNNAGHGLYGEFIDTDLETEIDIINLNVVSLVTLCKYFVRDMAAKGSGRILNTSSIASKAPGPWQSVYHGTKAFVQSFTEALRYEVKDKGISVTALLPGATDTDFFKKADMLESKVVQDPDNLADPAKVAKDGYEALMAGKDMVVSGFMNKVQVMMSNITPDEQSAAKMAKQQEPANQNTKK